MPPLHFFSTRALAEISCSGMERLRSGAKSPLPRLEQKIHPRVPRVPSRLGQVKPPSKDSLYTLQPKTSRQY